MKKLNIIRKNKNMNKNLKTECVLGRGRPTVVMRWAWLFLGLLLGASFLQAADTTWFKDSKYGLFVHYFPGVNDSISASAANGSWDTMVWNFNAPQFAYQASLTGAKYVVFTVGQGNGYYCSYNTTYEYYAGMPRGGFSPGRDLIKDIATALNGYGIKLIVYVAGEGPAGAAPYTASNGASVNVPSALQIDGTMNYSAGRYRFNNMIKEWSDRWGSSIAGWWIDGCWISGYSGSNVANLNDLIAACRSGNASSIVAANPGVDFQGLEYKALTTSQDYITGEDVIFRRYPASRYINYAGTGIQWHTTSFLGQDRNGQQGSGWGNPTASRFTDLQLIRYIKHVTENQGVVTMDVAVDATGNIYSGHLSQMQAVKSAVWSGGAEPASPNPSDLALFKPVRLMSNATNGLELPTNSFTRYSINPLGADYNNWAQAANEWAWNLQLDLRTSQTIRRTNIGFSSTNYATQFRIEYSTDGTSWATWATATAAQATAARTTAGTSLSGSGTGRYWRVKALAPNAAGQAGGQMGVRYWQLYVN
jgi:hypothetical protein